MKNYRGFEDATLDLDRPLTVLFGVNGSGKSSVLTACAATISRVLRDLRRDQDDLVWLHSTEDNDIRRGAEELLVRATLSNGDIVRDVTTHHYPGRKDDAAPLLHAANFSRSAVPIVSVFYGASREVAAATDAFLPYNNGSSTVAARPSSAIHDALAVGQLKFRSLFLWFKAREDVENELKVAQQNLSLEDAQLSAVRRAVAGMLPGFSGLRI
ncbi:MAG: AAA family ATPase, partial [Byssovorax sp.]